jgi:DNA-binding NarL/FixJ family response regulator
MMEADGGGSAREGSMTAMEQRTMETAAAHRPENGRMRMILVGRRALCRNCLGLLVGRNWPEIEVVEIEESDILAGRAETPKADLIMYTSVCAEGADRRTFAELRRQFPGTPIVVHTDTDDPEILGGLMEQGIAGIVPTGLSPDVAVAALRLVAAGGAYVPPNLLGLGPSGSRRAPAEPPSRRNSLTRRENEVFDLIARGMPNKEIAQRLGLAEATVKIHVQNIFKKLNVKNRTQLAYVASQIDAPAKRGGARPKR